MNSSLPHLIEFRTRLIHCAIFFMVFFALFFWIDEKLYTLIAQPMIRHLPKGSSLIATEVTSTFTVPMKLALITAFFACVPYFFYQIWSFVAPGLYRHEKATIFPMFIMSIILFYVGVGFSYTVICPMALKFFTTAAPPDVIVMTDIRHYLDFVLTLLLAGGIAFQVPVVTLALVHFGIASVHLLKHLRPYIIVAAFVLGMLLTPPDVVSQILLALPMWGLFELGLLLAIRLEKRKTQALVQ